MKKYILISIILSLLAPWMVIIVWWLDWSIAELYLVLHVPANGEYALLHQEIEERIAFGGGNVLQILSYMVILYCLYKLFKAYKNGVGSLRSVVYPSLVAGLSVAWLIFSYSLT